MEWTSLPLALGASLALTPLAIRVLGHFGVLDHPNLRSSHDRPMVRGGGLAPAVACAIAGAIAFEGGNRLAVGVLVAAASFGLIGVLEDLRGIPVLGRLGIQLAAASLASWWLLDDLLGPLAWQVVFAGGVVLWLAAYANAFNFMDGINGISVAQLVVAGVAWATLGTLQDVALLAQSGAIVAAGALGFLPFNFPRARVFLGDVGSYFLGAWLAASLVVGFRAELPPEAVLAPLSIYLADTATTMVKRVSDGESWHLPHRRHAYQRLVRMGWSHPKTTGTVAVFLVVSSVLGFGSLGPLWLRVVGDAAVASTLLAYLLLPRLVEGSAVRTVAAV